MTAKATVLCENSVQGNLGALAEHGWSVWIEMEGGPFLFDTGLGTTFLHNAHRFGVPVEGARAILLSHHHCDHTGGLLTALEAIRHGTGRETTPVHAHPDLFKDSFGEVGDNRTFVGLPHNRSVLEVAGADFKLETGWREIAPGLSMTGEIPRVTDYEVVLETMWHRDDTGEIVVDPIRDDQTVVIDTPDGLFVILGCSHAGLINILTYISEQTGKSNFHTIIGGTHLGPVGEEQLDATIAALHGLDIGRIGVSHCTGPKVAARMAREFGERFFFCNVGTVVEV
ncbi:MBL fold metallo-hydrolase [soil metagenome]